MSCGTCKKDCQSNKTQCPLCGLPTHKVLAEEVYSMVKNEVQPYLQEDRFYLCDNEECEVVFHSISLEEILLTQDINRVNLYRENIESRDEKFSNE